MVDVSVPMRYTAILGCKDTRLKTAISSVPLFRPTRALECCDVIEVEPFVFEYGNQTESSDEFSMLVGGV